jgi:hypothetical protein
MTVGRAISPECSTDERREWQNGAAALAISPRRPTDWLGSRMIRSMYASGSSPVAAASCRTSSFARLAAPLGRPAPGRFPPCPFIVLSRGRSKTAGRVFRYPVHLYYNTVQRATGRGTEFVNRQARKPTTNLNQMRGRSPSVLHEPLPIRLPSIFPFTVLPSG